MDLGYNDLGEMWWSFIFFKTFLGNKKFRQRSQSKMKESISKGVAMIHCLLVFFFSVSSNLTLEKLVVKKKKQNKVKQKLFYWLKSSSHPLAKWLVYMLWMPEDVFSVTIHFRPSDPSINHNGCLSSFSVYFLIIFVSLPRVMIRCKMPIN